MGRIRSIHPGQWTDEAFVECSFPARLLVFGLRNEADDNGVFEWKPLGLKMRLFPADMVDVAALLDELLQHRQVMRFEIGGRTYGAIRNFRTYQNPRSPKAEHPTTPEVEVYVGVREGDEIAEKRPVGRPRKQRSDETNTAKPKSFPQNVENNSLMEREREKESISPSDSSVGEPPDPSPPPSSKPIAVDDAGEALRQFDALRAELQPGTRPLAAGPDRRRKLIARLAEIGGLPEWAVVLAKIRGSPFLRGETSRWTGVCPIDWLLEPKNLRKVLEGNYDERDRDHGGGASRPVPQSPVDALAAARAAGGFG